MSEDRFLQIPTHKCFNMWLCLESVEFRNIVVMYENKGDMLNCVSEIVFCGNLSLLFPEDDALLA